MVCLSDNIFIGQHYTSEEAALLKKGEKEKRLNLKILNEDFALNNGANIPAPSQQQALRLPHEIKSEDSGRLFFAGFDGRLFVEGFDTVLRICGRLNSASIFLNGYCVAKLSNILMNAQINVTDYLRNKNTLFLVADDNHHKSSDIIHSITISHLPKSRITDLFLRNRLSLEKAEIFADVTIVSGDVEAAIGGKLSVSIFDGKKRVCEGQADIPSFSRNHWITVRVTLEMDSPRLWSVEDPYRYTVLLKLINSDKSISDVRRVMHGIRELRIINYSKRINAGPGFHLNGFPVKIFGAVVRNQYASLPAKLKASGFNAVRVVNPYDPSFLEACDSEGLLQMCESVFEVVSERRRTKKQGNVPDPLTRPFALLGEMVTQLKNFASVFCWSYGGYKYFGNGAIGEFIRSLDDTRAVQCEGDLNYKASDFFSASDCGISELKAFADKKTISDGRFLGTRIRFGRYKYHQMLLCEADAEIEYLKNKFDVAASADSILGIFIDIEGLDDIEVFKTVFH